jgi:ornithine cyclodeaminase/alanine dehydrogenase-like protein (mu-crystallin family)
VLGRVAADQYGTTFFKSCGLAVEDIAAAAAIVAAAAH